MNNLDKYEAVNKCETVDELADVMLSVIATKDGTIIGKSREFDADRMVNNLKDYVSGTIDNPNILTRRWGIRQQAMYIKYYTDK